MWPRISLQQRFVNVHQYSLEVLVMYSSEILLRPYMKPARYFQKDIDILELLCLDLPHSCKYEPFDVLVYLMSACILFVHLLLWCAHREACCV